MSLRTSAHTGVAIRVPAEKRCKPVGLKANSLRLAYSPKVLLFVLSHCKEYGLPRRFAPRNDMLKFAMYLHSIWALPVYCRKASLQPLTRHRLLHVIANQCAHWCGNPFPRRNTWQADCCSGKFVMLFVFAQSIASRSAPLQGEADCHVASLLAMTCRNLPPVRACNYALPAKPAAAYEFA